VRSRGAKFEIEKESESSDWKGTCREILSIGDLNIRVQRRKSFHFASGEVMRESQPSIRGGQVVEIKRSHELGGS
jgi:hypothetical protein